MYPVHETEDAMTYDNYGAVTLLLRAYQSLTNILYIKLVPYAEEIIGKYQGDVRKGRSTVDQIFTARQILEKFREQIIDVHPLGATALGEPWPPQQPVFITLCLSSSPSTALS